jgi:hypothetical protein
MSVEQEETPRVHRPTRAEVLAAVLTAAIGAPYGAVALLMTLAVVFDVSNPETIVPTVLHIRPRLVLAGTSFVTVLLIALLPKFRARDPGQVRQTFIEPGFRLRWSAVKLVRFSAFVAGSMITLLWIIIGD